ncbi:MAG: S1/P1 nuclease [Gammaproteobacteria bacterium]
MSKLYLIRLLTFLFFLLFMPGVFAWDASGHKVIAAIAYSQLTPQAKQRIDAITQTQDRHYPPGARFLYLAPLPDLWRDAQPDTQGWHYIDFPYATDFTPTTKVQSPNLLTAFVQNQKILISPTSTPQAKYRALAWIVHLVGDGHQPLHCINRFSAQFPKGDAGGNAFLIKDSAANNLHGYWDQAAHLLSSQHYPLSNKNIQKLAKALMNQYPKTSFSQLALSDFNQWVAECSALAKQAVYTSTITPNHKLPIEYKKQVAEVASQQLTLAGYRLGDLLNRDFNF